MASLTVLITNQFLANRTGTEMYAHDVALSLKESGHRPILYSPMLGPLADVLVDQGIEVVRDLSKVSTTPDVIHGQHTVPTLIALLRFPETPAIYVGHDSSWHLDMPPNLDRIRRFVVVDHNVLGRFVKREGICRDRIEVIPNGVDTDKFVRLRPLRERPARVLLFSNYLLPQHANIVAQVAGELGMEIDAIGKHLGGVCDAPEQRLGDYDIVFAKGRCAREAIAAGAAVIPAGEVGIGAMVTTTILPGMRKFNFGRRVLAHPWTPEKVHEMLTRYDRDDAEQVSEQVRRLDSLPNTMRRLCQTYQAVIEAETNESGAIEREIDFASDMRCISETLSEFVEKAGKRNLVPILKPSSAVSATNGRFDGAQSSPPPASIFRRLLRSVRRT